MIARQVAWAPRADPLAPCAVAGLGPAARALAQRLLARPPASEVTGVAAAGAIVVLGPEDALPWLDGLVWLGRDPAAPRLLLPTTLAPDVSPLLFERALVGRFGAACAPLAVLPAARKVVSVAEARPVEAARLEAWLAAA